MGIASFEQRRRTVATPSGDVSFIDTGAGPAALLVHGVLTSAHLWRPLIGRLGDRGRFIALDLPAHGHTPAPAEGSDLSLRAQADLLGDICDALDLEAVDVVSNDTGGAVAQVFAARHPNRIRSLAFTNCDTSDNLPPPAFQPAVDLANSGELAPLLMGLAADPGLARSEMGLGRGLERPDALTDEDLSQFTDAYATEPGARAVERFICALDADDVAAADPALLSLNVPAVIAWGTADVFFELSWAQQLRNRLGGPTELVEITGGKLFWPFERPDDLAPLLDDLWAEARTK